MHETGPLINLCLSRVDETLRRWWWSYGTATATTGGASGFLSVQRRAGDPAVAVRPGGQSRTWHRGMPPADAARRGRRRGPQWDGLAPSSHAFVHRHGGLVPDTHRGNNRSTCDDLAPDSRRHRLALTPRVSVRGHTARMLHERARRVPRHELLHTSLSLETA